MDKKADTKRVLIYRLGSMGDTIVALPCFHLIERTFPSAERRLLTNFPVAGKAAPSQAVFGESGLVHGYFAYHVKTRDILKLVGLILKIRKWGPEAVVHLMPIKSPAYIRRDVAFFRACGIRQCYGAPAAPETRDRLTLGPDRFQEHEAARLARCLVDLGDARLDDPASWDLRLTANEVETAERALGGIGRRPVIAMSLGTKNPSNEWGDDNWTELLGRLAKDYDAALVLLGAASESARCNAVAEPWRKRRGAESIYDLCGKLEPRQSAAVLRHATLFVGHDSGPIHLAAAMQTPCVGIYSSRHLPGAWFPYGKQNRVLYRPVDCMGCKLVTCVEQKQKCIRSITPEHVLEPIRELMSAAEAFAEEGRTS